MKINVTNDFSEVTGLRYCSISDKSGEEFYHTLLNEKFKEAVDKKEKLEVILDGTGDDGYSPSFIDEAFGNLVYDFGKDLVNKYLIVISESEPYIKDQIKDMTIPQWSSRRAQKEEPVVTENHSEWYRFTDDRGFVRKRWIDVPNK